MKEVAIRERIAVWATKIRLGNGEERDVLELEFVAQDENAVTHKGESVIIDPKFMTVGVPQVFRFIDKYMVAVKAEDGNMDLYYFPDSASGWEIDLSLLGNGLRFRRITRDNIADIEVCTTRMVRGGRGFPWDERIAIHPLPDGKIEIKRLCADETQA